MTVQLACEDQFEFNASFRKELKDLEMMETPSIGVDADGQRHWLLKVSCNLLRSLSLSLSLSYTPYAYHTPHAFFSNVLLSVHFKLPLGLKF